MEFKKKTYAKFIFNNVIGPFTYSFMWYWLVRISIWLGAIPKLRSAILVTPRCLNSLVQALQKGQFPTPYSITSFIYRSLAMTGL